MVIQEEKKLLKIDVKIKEQQESIKKLEEGESNKAAKAQ